MIKNNPVLFDIYTEFDHDYLTDKSGFLSLQLHFVSVITDLRSNESRRSFLEFLAVPLVQVYAKFNAASMNRYLFLDKLFNPPTSFASDFEQQKKNFFEDFDWTSLINSLVSFLKKNIPWFSRLFDRFFVADGQLRYILQNMIDSLKSPSFQTTKAETKESFILLDKYGRPLNPTASDHNQTILTLKQLIIDKSQESATMYYGFGTSHVFQIRVSRISLCLTKISLFRQKIKIVSFENSSFKFFELSLDFFILFANESSSAAAVSKKQAGDDGDPDYCLDDLKTNMIEKLKDQQISHVSIYSKDFQPGNDIIQMESLDFLKLFPVFQKMTIAGTTESSEKLNFSICTLIAPLNDSFDNARCFDEINQNIKSYFSNKRSLKRLLSSNFCVFDDMLGIGISTTFKPNSKRCYVGLGELLLNDVRMLSSKDHVKVIPSLQMVNSSSDPVLRLRKIDIGVRFGPLEIKPTRHILPSIENKSLSKLENPDYLYDYVAPGTIIQKNGITRIVFPVKQKRIVDVQADVEEYEEEVLIEGTADVDNALNSTLLDYMDVDDDELDEDYDPTIKVNRDAHVLRRLKKRKALDDQMRREQNAIPWNWSPSDPVGLQYSNNFGSNVYVRRFEGFVDKSRGSAYSILKNVTGVDPGVRHHNTLTDIGTGDVYIINPGLCDQLLSLNKLIAKMQSNIARQVELTASVVASKAQWDVLRKRRFRTDILPMTSEAIDALDKLVKDSFDHYTQVKADCSKVHVLQVDLNLLFVKRAKLVRSRIHIANVFMSHFNRIQPRFAFKDGLAKKKKGKQSIPNDIKSVMQLMSHARGYDLCERMAGKKGNWVAESSEACSTLLGPCDCLILHSPSMCF